MTRDEAKSVLAMLKSLSNEVDTFYAEEIIDELRKVIYPYAKEEKYVVYAMSTPNNAYHKGSVYHIEQKVCDSQQDALTYIEEARKEERTSMGIKTGQESWYYYWVKEMR